MERTSARPADDIEIILHNYGNILFRLCLVTLGNANDAEDAVQETLIKYMQKAPGFENGEHKKAWLLTVATNQCRDILRANKRHPVINIDEISEFTKEKSDSGIMDALMMLPEKFRLVLILYYVEDYSIDRIAK